MFYAHPGGTLEELEQRLRLFRPSPDDPHDPFIAVCIEESIAAIREGNFGVGACLVRDREIVQREHNRMFYPYFRSDLHAEMSVMTCFEDRSRGGKAMRDYTLYTSLEPCPMCTVRLITSGVGKVYYAALDAESGMMATPQRLTEVWLRLAERQEFAEARCSPELKEMARQAWLISANVNQEKVRRGER